MRSIAGSWALHRFPVLLAVAFAALVVPVQARGNEQAAEWITLGTSGGPSVRAERAQIANALVVGDALYLFDAGNDVQRQLARAGVPERNLRAIFVSHHHLDHNADIGPLMVTHWLFGQGTLRIFGPDGTTQLVDALALANQPTMLASFPTAGAARPPLSQTSIGLEVAANEEAPVLVYQDELIRVSAVAVAHYQQPPSVPLPHMPQALGYRIEVLGKVIAYTGDTGPSASLALLAENADLLISEVVEPDAIAALLDRSMPEMPAPAREGISRAMSVNHMVPAEIGKVARAAGVKQVVLTHFVPSPEELAEPGLLVQGVRDEFAGSVILARDLQRFRLPE